VPNFLSEQNNQTARIPQTHIPTVQEASQSYVAAGGHLSPRTQFGVDPLSESPDLLLQRQQALEQNIPTPEELFSFTVNGDYTIFAQSLQYMIHITMELQRLFL